MKCENDVKPHTQALEQIQTENRLFFNTQDAHNHLPVYLVSFSNHDEKQWLFLDGVGTEWLLSYLANQEINRPYTPKSVRDYYLEALKKTLAKRSLSELVEQLPATLKSLDQLMETDGLELNIRLRDIDGELIIESHLIGDEASQFACFVSHVVSNLYYTYAKAYADQRFLTSNEKLILENLCRSMVAKPFTHKAIHTRLRRECKETLPISSIHHAIQSLVTKGHIRELPRKHRYTLYLCTHRM